MVIGKKSKYKKYNKQSKLKLKEVIVINKRKMIFLAEYLKILKQNRWLAKKQLKEYNSSNVKRKKKNGIKTPFHRKNHKQLVWICK